jgi:hypothetical protein
MHDLSANIKFDKTTGESSMGLSFLGALLRRGAARCDTIGNDCLICRDIVRGHMFDGDLLLASAPVMVEPLGQQHHRSGSLIRKLQIFRPGSEKLRGLRPSLSVHRQRCFVRHHHTGGVLSGRLRELIAHGLAGLAASSASGPSAIDSPSGVESRGARVLLLESA